MIHFEPFLFEDLKHLPAPEIQPYLGQEETAERYRVMEVPDFAYSGFCDTRLVGCAGIYFHWPTRATAWAMFADVPRRAWPPIINLVRTVFVRAHRQGVRRIDTTVRLDFEAGHRFARRFGFVAEGLLRGYGPDGTDHIQYARVL